MPPRRPVSRRLPSLLPLKPCLASLFCSPASLPHSILPPPTPPSLCSSLSQLKLTMPPRCVPAAVFTRRFGLPDAPLPKTSASKCVPECAPQIPSTDFALRPQVLAGDLVFLAHSQLRQFRRRASVAAAA